MRTYEKTHPWISFNLDLSRGLPRLWMLLGEATSKVEHICGVPLLPSVARALHDIYLAKGVSGTTAIEGNTLSEEEVLARIKGELELPPSKEYLGKEIDNIIEACNQINESIFDGSSGAIEFEGILRFNELVLKGLPLDEDVETGKIRNHPVGVGSYRGAPAQDCQYLLEEMCRWLNDAFASGTLSETSAGLLKAIIAHVYIAWIHPFGDGNGRTARLIEFQMLLSVGVPSASAHLLSNHHNQTRSEYYRQLDRTHKSNGDLLPFIEYALQGFVDGLTQQIALIQGQQLLVHWINFIHDSFRDKDSASDVRRRRLAIDLAEQTDPLPVSKVRHVSPRIAEAYADKTDRTLRRDLNTLAKMKLIHFVKGGVITRRDLMLAFYADRSTDDKTADPRILTHRLIGDLN